MGCPLHEIPRDDEDPNVHAACWLCHGKCMISIRHEALWQLAGRPHIKPEKWDAVA